MNALVGMVIGDAAQYFVNDLHHRVIDLQFAARAAHYQPRNVEMQELRFRRRFVQGGMQVVVAEECRLSILLQ